VLFIFVDAGTQGLEEKQAETLFKIVALLFCPIQFLLSLPAFFSIKPNIQKNKLYSFLTFFSLPLLLLFFTLYVGLFSAKQSVDYYPIVPCVIYIVTLLYFFEKFQDHINKKERT
jgi:cytochrome bd-type quinol oxidase subunit 2